MKCALFFVAAILSLAPPVARADADACRGAYDALNRVKEGITPRLNASTEAGRHRLQVMHSSLLSATRICRGVPELWYYLMIVSQHLDEKIDADNASRHLEGFDNGFDPFSMPAVAAAPPAGDPGKNVASIGLRKKWALVVGIDQFQDDRVPRLDFAVKDSHDFATYLASPKGGHFDPAHIFTLNDSHATLQGIREGMGRLRALAHPDDLVVVYIASHGSPRDSDPDGVSYILAYDSSLENAATLYGSSLQMIDLVQQINRQLKSRQVVLILDTCYSGDALASSSPSAGQDATRDFSHAFDNLSIGYGRAVLTASRANERSWESKRLGSGGNGYFTYFLLQVLGESRAPTLDQVFAEVSRRVADRVNADLHVTQNPSFAFSEQARTIVLTTPELPEN